MENRQLHEHYFDSCMNVLHPQTVTKGEPDGVERPTRNVEDERLLSLSLLSLYKVPDFNIDCQFLRCQK